MILDKKSAQMIIDGLDKMSEDLMQKSRKAYCRYGELLWSTEKNAESIQQAYIEALTAHADVRICLRLKTYIYKQFLQD